MARGVYFDILNRFCMVDHACDRRTDGRTDGYSYSKCHAWLYTLRCQKRNR